MEGVEGAEIRDFLKVKIVCFLKRSDCERLLRAAKKSSVLEIYFIDSLGFLQNNLKNK